MFCRGTTSARGDLELGRISPLWGPGTKIRISSPLVVLRPIYYEYMSQISNAQLLSMPARPSLVCSYLREWTAPRIPTCFKLRQVSHQGATVWTLTLKLVYLPFRSEADEEQHVPALALASLKGSKLASVGRKMVMSGSNGLATVRPKTSVGRKMVMSGSNGPATVRPKTLSCNSQNHYILLHSTTN